MIAGGSEKPATHETVDAGEHYLRQDGKKVYIDAVKGMANVSKKIFSFLGA